MMSSGAGADFVMMGGMLAGHDQSGEDIDVSNYVYYYGICTNYTVYWETLTKAKFGKFGEAG